MNVKYKRVAQAEDDDAMHTAVLDVRGMHCASCSSAVQKALEKTPGVTSAAVNLLAESASVIYDPSVVQAAGLAEAVDECGFEAEVRASPPSLAMAVLDVAGMHCSACSSAVEAVLQSAPGVATAAVSLLEGAAQVTFDPCQTSPAGLAAAVNEAGFEAVARAVQSALHFVRIEVAGGCAAVATAADVLATMPGAAAAVPEDREGMATGAGGVLLTFDAAMTGPRDALDLLAARGVSARLAPADSDLGAAREAAAAAEQMEQLLAAAVFTAPLVFIAKIAPLLPGISALLRVQLAGFPLDELAKWILCTPVQFVVGWGFHTRALRALQRRAANMDVLVSMGTNASYAYSVISILHHHFSAHHQSGLYAPSDFFEGAALLVFFILLGKWLEARARRATAAGLTQLLSLAPERATLVKLDSGGRVLEEREIEGRLVQVGDILRLLPGARVPADGALLQGETHADEHMLTGESAPVAKRPGDTVTGGTIIVGKAALMRAARVGADTTLAAIAKLVADAQLCKAPVQAFADRISAVFVPIVVAVAAATMAGWWVAGAVGLYPRDWIPLGDSLFLFSLLFGISVLVIACPCALGLATPTAVMVGTGVGARQGILIKGGDALERGAAVNVVVFDKTGTVTHGRPIVVGCHVVARGADSAAWADETVAAVAGSVEAESEHPLARALVNWADAVLASIPRATGTEAAGTAEAEAVAAAGVRGGSEAQRDIVQAQVDAFDASRRDVAKDRRWLLRTEDVEYREGRGVTGWVDAYGPPGSGLGLGAAAAAAKAASGIGADGHAPTATTRVPVAGSGRAQMLAVAVGNRKLMAEIGADVSDAHAAEWLRVQEDRGRTGVFVAISGAVVALLAVQDPIKPEARGVVARLQQQNIEVHLITGDNWRTARSIGEQLGVADVDAEVAPAGKERAIRALQGRGRTVAMVGDGINDAPALAAADVGVAVGSGTEVAVETADIVLVRSDLEDVVVALDLARATFRRIKANYGWALIYNALMIPVAAGALYPAARVRLPPVLAGVAMASSSISVVCSSLLLGRYRRPPPVLRDFAWQERLRRG